MGDVTRVLTELDEFEMTGAVETAAGALEVSVRVTRPDPPYSRGRPVPRLTSSRALRPLRLPELTPPHKSAEAQRCSAGSATRAQIRFSGRAARVSSSK